MLRCSALVASCALSPSFTLFFAALLPQTVSAQTVSAQAVPAQKGVPRVLLAKTADGLVRAYYSPDVGLWLSGFKGRKRLVIGHGCEPRFDTQGRLWFTRAYDDGHQLRRRVTLRLDSPQRAARVMTEPGPAYRLPALQAPQGAVIKLAVDAGHGGSDPGAGGNGLKEAAVTLALAQRLQYWLDLDTKDTRGGGSWQLLMTRTSDRFVSLAARANAANAFGAASFLSLHMNSFSSASANGSESYCYRGQENRAGGQYRNRVQKELLAAWSLRNRGVKTAGFYVLRFTRMPAVLLEGGFITNSVDAARMKDARKIDRLALGLLWATQEHHGIKRYTPSAGSGGNRTGVLRGVVFDVTKGTSARIANASIILSDGSSQRSLTTTGGFSFVLKPGNYRYIASAPGFGPAELTRSVVAGQTIWGSPGLQPERAPAIDCPAVIDAGKSLAISVQADPRSPVLLLLSGHPRIVSLPPFGVSIPDLQALLLLQAGASSASGNLHLALPTSASLRGLWGLLQPFALRDRAWKLGNTVGFKLR